jgi:hypothetical protein
MTEYMRQLFLRNPVETFRRMEKMPEFTPRQRAELRSQIECEKLRHEGRKILRRCMGL